MKNVKECYVALLSSKQFNVVILEKVSLQNVIRWSSNFKGQWFDPWLWLHVEVTFLPSVCECVCEWLSLLTSRRHRSLCHHCMLMCGMLAS